MGTDTGEYFETNKKKESRWGLIRLELEKTQTSSSGEHNWEQ